jgi:Phage T4 tail fibre
MNSLTKQYPSLMKTRVFSSSLLSLMFMALTNPVQAQQWTTVSTNIHNSNTGNVGINNTNPLVKLAVDISSTTTTYNGYTGANVALMLKNKSNTANNFTVLSFANSGTNTIADITAINTNHSTHTGRLSFSTRAAGAGPQQRMLIDENGNVGIGTTSPGGKLEINHAGGQIKLTGGTIAGGLWTNTTEGLYLADWNTGTKGLLINMSTGNVGIGTTAPEAKLHVKGVAYFGNENGYSLHRIAVGGSGSDYGSVGYGFKYTNNNLEYKYSVDDYASQLRFDLGGFNFLTAPFGIAGNQVPFTSVMSINHNGNVGIGTTTPDAKLAVKGTIHTQEVRVDLNGAVAPDYVFEKDYNLMPLDELKVYLEANKHLPEVPSAKEMDAQGVNLKEMNLLLLKKVEELTLYLIEMKRENKEIKDEINKLKN